jgi:hypothetical protein
MRPESTVKLHFDRTPVADFPALLAHYSDKALASAHRSTVPLLCLLKDGWLTLLDAIVACGIAEVRSLHFEFRVYPQRGKGTPSHTDLLARSVHSTLAIEAKWTEPTYEVVRQWRQSGPNKKNRCKVVTGWLDLLRPHAQRQLVLGEFDHIVYQMLHRAASSCIDRTAPRLAYLQFTPQPSGGPGATVKYDLVELHRLLGQPKDFPFYLIEIEVTPTRYFRPLEPLVKGLPMTGRKVRSAILGSQLFEFAQFRVHQI